MFKYLRDWPFLAVLVAFNMVRIAEQVYMILYKQGVPHEPQQVWRRDTKCPFIKQKVLATIIGDRAAEQILPLWHVWGSIHCRWGFCPWNPHSGGDWQKNLYFRKRRKWSIVIPFFFTQSCLRSCFELGGGYLMAAGPFEKYCSIASTKIVVSISRLENSNPCWFSPAIHL